MTEGLNDGLELVVTVEVGGEASWVERLLELGLERVHNEAALNVGVGREDRLGVDFLEFEGPLGDHDNLRFEVLNLEVGELGVVLGDGGVGEVGGNVEVGVRHQEEGAGFLHEDLEILGAHLGGEGVVVTSVLDHMRVESLESGLFHFLCLCD